MIFKHSYLKSINNNKFKSIIILLFFFKIKLKSHILLYINIIYIKFYANRNKLNIH